MPVGEKEKLQMLNSSTLLPRLTAIESSSSKKRMHGAADCALSNRSRTKRVADRNFEAETKRVQKFSRFIIRYRFRGR
jgi:hypothetical protein